MEALHLTIIQETQDNEKGTIIKAEAQVGPNQGPNLFSRLSLVFLGFIRGSL